MNEEKKYPWQKMYTVILIANAVYILIFYFITQYFTE